MMNLQIGDKVCYKKLILLGGEVYNEGVVLYKNEDNNYLLTTGDVIHGIDKYGDYISIDFSIVDAL